jgi:hypothetical protein
MEEEVEIIKMEILVRTAESEVGIEPLVAISVEITKAIVEETNV